MFFGYKTNVLFSREAYLEAKDIASILEQEKKRLLGGQNRYISKIDNCIYENYYNIEDKVREATAQEVEIYNALNTLIEHFRKLDR